jgi:hypothetical protein
MRIEVLKCVNCGRLAISVDDIRETTVSVAGAGHGSGKCSGGWTIQVYADYEEPVQGLTDAESANKQAANNG